MRSTAILAVLVLAISTQAALAQSAQCPAKTKKDTVFILKGAKPEDVINAVSPQPNNSTENALVLLAPDVDITFSNLTVPTPSFDTPFIIFARCVTLASFQPPPQIDPHAPAGDVVPPVVPGSGRTPHSLGPVLRYNLDGERGDSAAFIQMACNSDSDNDGARVLGIRIFGPNFNDHQSSERGINILGCHDVEIANNEVAGWSVAINVDGGLAEIPTEEPKEIFIKIHDNYIHHNQHSESGSHSEGYGVEVRHGAFAAIYQNVFDYNKHSITADSDAGGYYAGFNLILKGGGFQNSFWERNIHVFDVHGSGNCLFDNIDIVVGGVTVGGLLGGLIGGPVGAIVGGIVGGLLGGGPGQHTFNCGDAGFSFDIVDNTFQYNKTYDIKIRGRPKGRANIALNIFARANQDDAINLFETDNVLLLDNQFNDDTFGQYGVCDIDGDGIDDLVLMTGTSWWFSSAGQFPWSFLRPDAALLKDVQLGDFDGDGRCDVIKDEKGDGTWTISSGATEGWKPFGNFLAPLNQVRFGRFDPSIRDHRHLAIRPPTHAFWRSVDAFWFVTPLSHPNQWTVVNSSSFPLADLRFGSFTGDSVTDVLAIEEGHWAISHAAIEMWKNLNPTLSDPVKNSNIFIANMNGADNNDDDVLRFDVGSFQSATWQRSSNGTAPWSQWKNYAFTVSFWDWFFNKTDYVSPTGFVGQFAAAPGASTLTIDPNRVGHFFSPAQGSNREEWVSQPPGAPIPFSY